MIARALGALLGWLVTGALAHATLGPRDIAVIINDADPHSVEIGLAYQKARRIPDDAVLRVRFAAGKQGYMAVDSFKRVKQEVDARTPSRVQAFALAWTSPWGVGCMSVTSAFAFGFDEKYCAKGCKPTAPSPYFNSMSKAPATDLKLRPAMLLAGETGAEVAALVARGLEADESYPNGAAYLMRTSDSGRNTRAALYPSYVGRFKPRMRVHVLDADVLEGRQDVLFYFTGLARVKGIGSNRYLPGAMADHLTSTGGVLRGGRQMSALRWLEAGATASYGTVREPCSYPQKFPHPGVAMAHYLNGDALVEAYWKSVAWPGQGVFIGEPLAAPFAVR